MCEFVKAAFVWILVISSLWSIMADAAFSTPRLYGNTHNVLPLAASLDPDNNEKSNRGGNAPVINIDTRRRRIVQQQQLLLAATAFIGGMMGPIARSATTTANAAPPMAVIAEELGYFPVRNRAGDLVYIPKRVVRQSSEQAVLLAAKLREEGVAVFTAYWCPHCARQSELFGREAWEEQIRRVECSPAGYGANPSLCLAKQVDGYPTWIFPKNNNRAEPLVISGERPLSELAQAVGFSGFKPELETNLPPLPGSAACKQK